MELQESANTVTEQSALVVQQLAEIQTLQKTLTEQLVALEQRITTLEQHVEHIERRVLPAGLRL